MHRKRIQRIINEHPFQPHRGLKLNHPSQHTIQNGNPWRYNITGRSNTNQAAKQPVGHDGQVLGVERQVVQDERSNAAGG